MSASQSARSVLMVSPASFGYDEETAATNAFQIRPNVSESETTARAMREFDAAVDQLRQANIDVVVYQGDPNEDKPDAVFPNNWLSTWPDGRVYLYPMATDSRRSERDDRVLDQLRQRFVIDQVIDISGSEAADKFLESTGVIIFDHLEKIAYGCLSPRCDEAIFTSHVSQLGYQPITFHAYDQTGVPIYHTNVMMGIQSTTAVICTEAITDALERQTVLDTLSANRRVVDISFEQMGAFCGNVLEVENTYGGRVLVVSQSAYDAFTPEQIESLSLDKAIVPINIPTIEQAGGGSARCMLAEIFLPTKS